MLQSVRRIDFAPVFRPTTCLAFLGYLILHQDSSMASHMSLKWIVTVPPECFLAPLPSFGRSWLSSIRYGWHSCLSVCPHLQKGNTNKQSGRSTVEATNIPPLWLLPTFVFAALEASAFGIFTPQLSLCFHSVGHSCLHSVTQESLQTFVTSSSLLPSQSLTEENLNFKFTFRYSLTIIAYQSAYISPVFPSVSLSRVMEISIKLKVCASFQLHERFITGLNSLRVDRSFLLTAATCTVAKTWHKRNATHLQWNTCSRNIWPSYPRNLTPEMRAVENYEFWAPRAVVPVSIK